MKLFAFRPFGHGSYSFYVMAETKEEAVVAVETWAYNEYGKHWQKEYEMHGWGTDYNIEIAERGRALTNAND